MKKTGFVLALLAGIVIAGGAGVWSQEETTSAQTTATWGGRLDDSVFAELGAVYGSLSTSAREVSDTFDVLLYLTYYGRVAPDKDGQEEHVQEILVLLVGPYGEGVDPSIYETSGGVYPEDGYLIGPGGRLEGFTSWFETYMNRVESYSDVLIAFYAEKCRKENAGTGCNAASGHSMLDRQLDSLALLADRVVSMAGIALEAARRIDLDTDPAGANDRILTVYTCAVAARGYWPELAEGDFRASSTTPSTLHDFLDLLERVNYDLFDAINAAMHSS